jgi:ribosomal protein L22
MVLTTSSELIFFYFIEEFKMAKKSVLEELRKKKEEQERKSVRIDVFVDRELADALEIIKNNAKETIGMEPKELFTLEIIDPKRKFLLTLASELSSSTSSTSSAIPTSTVPVDF